MTFFTPQEPLPSLLITPAVFDSKCVFFHWCVWGGGEMKFIENDAFNLFPLRWPGLRTWNVFAGGGGGGGLPRFATGSGSLLKPHRFLTVKRHNAQQTYANMSRQVQIRFNSPTWLGLTECHRPKLSGTHMNAIC